MIAFFPEPYEDELVFSWFSRYLVYSGYTAASDSKADLFNSKTVRPSVELMNNLSQDVRTAVERYKSMEKVVYENTMFAEYGRFIDQDQREKMLKSYDFTIGNWTNLLMRPPSGKARFLRYCPTCARVDREEFGETYWHRRHQINRIQICIKHKEFLKNSIVRVDRYLSRLIAAETVVPYDDLLETCRNDTIISLASYMDRVFASSRYCYSQVGRFLNDRMSGEFRYENGNCKLTEFFDAYRAFYSSVNDEELMTIDYLSKLLRGQKSQYCYICQLALFENVSVDDLLESKSGQNNETIFNRVSLITGESIEVVEKIGTAVLNEYLNYGGRMLSHQRFQNNNDSVDKGLVLKVEEVCAEIYGQDNKRPKKVGISTVARIIRIDPHKLKRLPRCMDVINSFYETQEQYWAREIVWAVEQIRNNREPLNLKHIRNYTNLRRDNIVDSMNELRMINMDAYEEVKRII